MIHLQFEFIDSLSLHKKEDSNAAHSQILKNFHNVLQKLLDPQSCDLIHSAVCFIIHPFWHAFEVDILSLHTYVTNSIHSLGISKYQLTMYFLISGSF